MQYPLGTLDCWNASNVNCTVRDKQCGYGCVENAGEEISHMADYPYIRLLEDGGRSSDVPVADARNGGWHSPTERDGVFSAMCWFLLTLAKVMGTTAGSSWYTWSMVTFQSSRS